MLGQHASPSVLKTLAHLGQTLAVQGVSRGGDTGPPVRPRPRLKWVLTAASSQPARTEPPPLHVASSSPSKEELELGPHQ